MARPFSTACALAAILALLSSMVAAFDKGPAIRREARISADGDVSHDATSAAEIRSKESADDGMSTDLCTLPKNARWCTVKVQGIQDFQIAVYNSSDFVSSRICQDHAWEISSVNHYGTPGYALDIGGHLGYYALTLARAGWIVSTFEPVPENRELIAASLCKNPDLAQRVSLHVAGLGSKVDNCQLISPNDNVGNGQVRCGDQAEEVPAGWTSRGPTPVGRLDDEIDEMGWSRVDFVHLDVSGYECEVIEGARSFLAKYKPRMIQTEPHGTNAETESCKTEEYLNAFQAMNYAVDRDIDCGRPDRNLLSEEEQEDYKLCPPPVQQSMVETFQPARIVTFKYDATMSPSP